MNLDRVTITGADESIAPSDLFELSAEFPFVEWGILYSHRHSGTPRYPRNVWSAELADLAEKTKINLSAHICGRWVRDVVLGGEFTWRDVFAGKDQVYQRIQLNFHAEPHNIPHPKFFDIVRDDGRPFILQQDGVNDAMLKLCRSEHGLANVLPLFDVSGGAGILPRFWPMAHPNVYQGYAGGLGPVNIVDQIKLIGEAAGAERIWIDMETKVRSSDDRLFDLSKVRDCLVQAKPFVT